MHGQQNVPIQTVRKIIRKLYCHLENIALNFNENTLPQAERRHGKHTFVRLGLLTTNRTEEMDRNGINNGTVRDAGEDHFCNAETRIIAHGLGDFDARLIAYGCPCRWNCASLGSVLMRGAYEWMWDSYYSEIDIGIIKFIDYRRPFLHKTWHK